LCYGEGYRHRGPDPPHDDLYVLFPPARGHVIDYWYDRKAHYHQTLYYDFG
jgi:hypothetical protein